MPHHQRGSSGFSDVGTGAASAGTFEGVIGSGLSLSYIDLQRQRQRQLYQHDWVVYAKTPLGGPAQVLEYLSRYTHRTAIGNERIRAVNDYGWRFRCALTITVRTATPSAW